MDASRSLVTRDVFLGEYTTSMADRSEYIGPHCRFTTVGAKVLGAPIGTDAFMWQFLLEEVEGLLAKLERLKELAAILIMRETFRLPCSRLSHAQHSPSRVGGVFGSS